MISNPRVIHVSTYEDAVREIKAVGACGAGARAMADKARHMLIRLDHVPSVAANILKQEMLSKGGEAAVSKGTVDLSDKHTSVLLMGTVKHYKALITKLKLQQFKLPVIASEIEDLLKVNQDSRPGKVIVGQSTMHWGARTYIMGILNITPDSFSDGGQYTQREAAVQRALQMEAEGADIIDIGAESSRPGHIKLSYSEESARLFPVLEEVLSAVSIPVSVDTTKVDIARKALEMGVGLVNDISGPGADPAMAALASENEVPIVIMHNRKEPVYKDLMGEIIADLRHSIDLALENGVQSEQIILDPGIGFGKTGEQNLIVLKRLKEITSLGFPVLIGTSRKSFIGKVLDVPVEDRLEGTAATVSISIAAGADIVRVHDVREMKRIATMSDSIFRLREE